MTSLDRAEAAYAAAVATAKVEVAGYMLEAEEAIRKLLPHVVNGDRSMLQEMRSRLEVDRHKLEEQKDEH